MINVYVTSIYRKDGIAASGTWRATAEVDVHVEGARLRIIHWKCTAAED